MARQSRLATQLVWYNQFSRKNQQAAQIIAAELEISLYRWLRKSQRLAQDVNDVLTNHESNKIHLREIL